MTNLQFIRQYFADPVRLQCINQHEVENLAGVKRGTIQTVLMIDDAISEEDMRAVVTVLDLLNIQII